MWKPKEVYIVTAFFKDDSYSSPSEEFFADTIEEAERKRAELLEDPEYDDVMISDEKEVREFWQWSLDELIRQADKIREDQALSSYKKDVKLADLMTLMESEYGVPVLKNPEWEEKHPDVFRTYKKISDMREL